MCIAQPKLSDGYVRLPPKADISLGAAAEHLNRPAKSAAAQAALRVTAERGRPRRARQAAFRAGQARACRAAPVRAEPALAARAGVAALEKSPRATNDYGAVRV